MTWRPNVKKSMNLVSILLAVVSAVCVCMPFEGKKRKVRCIIVPFGLPESSSILEFPCLLNSFQSYVLCRVA